MATNKSLHRRIEHRENKMYMSHGLYFVAVLTTTSLAKSITFLPSKGRVGRSLKKHATP
jgi:hypothetical protein